MDGEWRACRDECGPPGMSGACGGKGGPMRMSGTKLEPGGGVSSLTLLPGGPGAPGSPEAPGGPYGDCNQHRSQG